MSLNAVILADGEFPKKPYPRFLLEQADVIVCCDGAVRAFYRHFGDGRRPDAIIGDMDSIPAKLRARYEGLLVPIAEQETNDQTKALSWLLDHYSGIFQIVILGATGKREDHTIGNLSLLMEYACTRGLDGLTEPSIRIVSDYSEAFALTDTCTIYPGQGRGISVFSPDNSLIIKSKGLQWPLDNVVWDNWWKATLNRTTDDAVTLEFSHSSLALVILQ